jgi:phosphate/sulfate permease
MGQLDCFYTSYLTVMYRHPLSVSVAVVLTIISAIGLAETTPADWTHGEKILLTLISHAAICGLSFAFCFCNCLQRYRR